MNEFYEYIERVDFIIATTYKSTLLVVGMLGNFLILYVYRSKYYRKTSTGFYYSCLAVTNTIALLIGALHYFLKKVDFPSTYAANIYCKLLSEYCTNQLSSWINVIISIDQLIFIRGLKQFYFTRRLVLQISVICTTLFILVAINIPNFIYMEANWDNFSLGNVSYAIFYCEIKVDEPYYNFNIRDQIDLFVDFIVPFVLILFCSIMIAWMIMKSKKNIIADNHNTASLKKSYQLSLTILGVNLISFFLKLPVCVYVILLNFREPTTDIIQLAYQDLRISFLDFLVCMNYSCAIFIHLTLNQSFRVKLTKIFKVFFKRTTYIFSSNKK